MARFFESANTEYLQVSDTPVSAYPFSVSLWFNPNVLQSQAMFSFADSSAGRYFRIRMSDFLSTPGDYKVQIQSWDGSGGYRVTRTLAVADTWQHVAAVFTSSKIEIAIDGDTLSNTTADITSMPTFATIGADSVSIGVNYFNGGVSQPFQGGIAEVGFYNDELVQADVDMLAAYWSPPSVRPDALVRYWPLRNDDDDVEECAGVSISAINTPTYNVHPPINDLMGVLNVNAGGVSTQTLVTESPTIDLQISDAALSLGAVTLAVEEPTLDFAITDATLSVGAVTLATEEPTLSFSISDATMTVGAFTLATEPATLDFTIADATITPTGAVTLVAEEPTFTFTITDTVLALGALSPPSECFAGVWCVTEDLSGTWEPTINLSGDWTNC